MNVNSKSLQLIVNQVADLEQRLIEAGGEITPEIEEALITQDIQLPEKVDNYALVMDRMNAIASFYKDKSDFFLRLSRAASSVVDRCKDNLKIAMTKLETDELVGFDMKFRLMQASPSCIIEDESKIPKEYKVTETITKIDKKRIAEDLKLGVGVEGARLEKSSYVRPFANTPNKKAPKKKNNEMLVEGQEASGRKELEK